MTIIHIRTMTGYEYRLHSRTEGKEITRFAIIRDPKSHSWRDIMSIEVHYKGGGESGKKLIPFHAISEITYRESP